MERKARNLAKTLYVVGLPLDETKPLSPEALATFQSVALLIGESRKSGARRLAEADCREKPICWLDNIKPDEGKKLRHELSTLFSRGEDVALFSDCGMPILFDPGSQILHMAREIGFTLRSVPSATSWGTACTLSGFEPPFEILGFLPQKKEERVRALQALKNSPRHTVLMEAPYRFRLLLEEAQQVLGGPRHAFLAWEISSSQEWLAWGTLSSLARESEKRGLTKGEFILIIEAK